MAIFSITLICLLLLWQKTSALSSIAINYSLPKTPENVGELCATQMEAFLQGLTAFDLWAMTMFDASSKIPVGLLRGNLYDYGNYDECMEVEHEDQHFNIKGKYCWAAVQISLPTAIMERDIAQKLSPNIKSITNDYAINLNNGRASSINLALSLCIPDGCEPTEIAEYLQLADAQFNNNVCVTKEAIESRSLDAGDIAAIVFLSIILFFMITCTAYDIYLYKTSRAPAHQIFLSFSVFTNGRKLLAINNDDKKQLTSLYGLRSISMIWVVCGHRFAVYANLPAVNMLDIVEWPSKLYTQYIQSAPIAVDTFFCLSGMMISYGFFSMKTKPKGASFIPKLYLHRYLRITPAVAVLFFIAVTIWKHLDSGPLWSLLAQNRRDPCLNWWWSYFLYVQNYVNHNDFCIDTTWYLSADMQLFLLSPFILLPLGYIMKTKSKKFVFGTCTCLILAFMIIQAVIRLNVESSNTFMTHERLSIWMVGFTTGILLKEVKSGNFIIKLNSALNLIIWIGVLVGMVSILLTMHDVRQNPTDLKTNMFDTFHRPAWGLGLTWIVYSSTIGCGGFVNWLLSLPAFHVLSRLTYSMYLVHLFVILYTVGVMRMPWYFTEFITFYNFCGDIICTTIVAFIWVLAFESPVIVIEKCLFDRSKGPKEEKKIDAGNTLPPNVPINPNV